MREITGKQGFTTKGWTWDELNEWLTKTKLAGPKDSRGEDH